MRSLKITTCCVCFVMLYWQKGSAQSTPDYITLPLNDLTAFRNPGNNWVIAAGVTTDMTKAGDIQTTKGNGVLIDLKNNHTNLVTQEEFGDLDLELDFMLTKSANSGIFLQGRYEIQLNDSWTNTIPRFSDCGGINQRWDGNKGYEGIAPMINVARAPGLWQHLTLKFRAPQFDAQGKKIANARFIEVYVNGALVQQQVNVTGPTQYALFQDERPTGPLVFQDDQGAIAFKNIHYRRSVNENPAFKVSGNPYFGETVPIFIAPGNRPFLQRSYMFYGKTKITTAISVGNPNHVNYSYDLKEGALFQIWRGKFLDATDMWFARGDEQVTRPMGSVITLSDAPVFSVLHDTNTAWPDSVAYDDFITKGYSLDQQRSPTFRYAFNGITFSDKITVESNGQSLTRELQAVNAPENLYCRIAAGDNIEKIDKDLYGVNGRSYYIRIDKRFKPLIRQSQKGQEMIILYDNSAPVTYSIIW